MKKEYVIVINFDADKEAHEVIGQEFKEMAEAMCNEIINNTKKPKIKGINNIEVKSYIRDLAK